jgi:hypothetical protein
MPGSKRGTGTNVLLPPLGSPIQTPRAGAVKRSQHASDSLSLTVCHGVPTICLQSASAPACRPAVCLPCHKPLADTATTMAGLRYNNHGCAAEGTLARSGDQGRHATNESQILSQDLEQADPTVYQIIEKVRYLPLNPERHAEPG